ncbi:MAG: class I SAM-dependent methyltransferase [Xanthomonadales bacterium]|jgi:SAM-dependent methyltransferase|nr:class I SAM-dependent methyltransferase [Xanthomonadales bacterium]
MPVIRELLARAATSVFRTLAPVRYKQRMELAYWRGRVEHEGRLRGPHYEFFYTDFFGLDRGFYAGKRVLDIGCGPRGSLEWLAAEAECTGLDPLVPQYRALGIDQHRMTYVHAGAERIPFPDGHFQVVTTFNNLDHVDDVAKAIAEMKRVTSPDGTLLLITEVEHEASPTEPQTLPTTIAHQFEPEFAIQSQGLCAIRDDHNVYQSLRDQAPYRAGTEGIVFARFTRN